MQVLASVACPGAFAGSRTTRSTAASGTLDRRANPRPGARSSLQPVYAKLDKGAEPSDADVACDIAIIGGGLGGLAMAAGLHFRGYDARVYERGTQLRSENSTLISLGRNALNSLDRLHPDIVPELLTRASERRIATRTIRIDKAHDMVVEPLPVVPGWHGVRWSQLKDILADLVPSDWVHCSARAVGYTEEEDCVRVRFEDGEEVTACLAIAGDGLRSALRATMIPHDPGPRYLGHMNWSALIHNPDSSVVKAHQSGEQMMFYNNPDSQHSSMNCLVSDAGCGYTFWTLTQQADTPAFTCPASGQPSAAQAHGGGLGCPGSKARLVALLEELGWDTALKVVQATPESDIYERALYDRLPLDQLGASNSSPGGRVVLIGDAAHAMHPRPGQGARTAFEDAETFISQLETHRSALVGWKSGAGAATQRETSSPSVGTDDKAALSAAVAGYAAARLARTCRIQRYAAEACGLASIRDQAWPADVSRDDETFIKRFLEFFRWIDSYPDKPSGDPESTFWKPTEQATTSKQTQEVVTTAAPK